MIQTVPRAVAIGCCWCCLVVGGSSRMLKADNVVKVDTREEFARAVEQARPGTTILLAPGSYRGGFHFDRLQGTLSQQIVIAGASKTDRPVIQGGGTGLHLVDPVHVVLRDLVIERATGNGVNIDDGGSYDTPAHHVELRHIAVRDIGPRGNRDGIKLSGLDDFVVEACVVERWGDGGSGIDMVGCHRGKISGCTFRFRDNAGSNGVQTKGGSASIVIERSQFLHTGSRGVNIGGSTGMAYFRPSDCTYEAKEITVHDNTFVGSQAPVAFVGVDGAVVQYNTIVQPARWVLRILQETREPPFVRCRKGRFANNLIVFRSDQISTTVNIGPDTAPQTFRFAANHWYCIDRPDRSSRLSLPTAEQGGVYGVNPQLRVSEAGDVQIGRPDAVQNAGVRPLAAPHSGL